MSDKLITDISEIQALKFSGYSYIYTEKGAYHFSKKTPTGWLEMRCIPSDMVLSNLECMAKYGLTNTNKVPKDKTI